MKDALITFFEFIFKAPPILCGLVVQYLGWIITTIPRAFWQGLKNGWNQRQIYSDKD